MSKRGNRAKVCLPDPMDRLPVYVYDAQVQEGPLSDKPLNNFVDQLCEAAGKLFEKNSSVHCEIEGVFLGAMGLFPPEVGVLAPSSVLSLICDRLHLNHVQGSRYSSFFSTSESGAVVLLKALEALREGKYETVLVLAGEAMFSQKISNRVSDRSAIDRVISSVLHPDERSYGLSMLRVGDLFMDHLIWRSGLPSSVWREILQMGTLNKYSRASIYPSSMHAFKERHALQMHHDKKILTWQNSIQEDFNPFRSSYFRRHDVVAPCNGATALILTRKRDICPRKIRLFDMSEGHSRLAISERKEAFGHFSAIREAVRCLCLSSQIKETLLTDIDWTRGIFHDAFPSIEFAFLKEIGQGQGWVEWIRRFLTSWSNPLGGLCAAGHALGNSGLFQVAQAFHLATLDKDHLLDPCEPLAYGDPLDERISSGKIGFYLTSSVGAALTSVILTLLIDEENMDAFSVFHESSRQYDKEQITKKFSSCIAMDPVSLDSVSRLKKGEGIVLASSCGLSESSQPSICIVHNGQTLCMAGVEDACSPRIGDRVKIRIDDGKRGVTMIQESCLPHRDASETMLNEIRSILEETSQGPAKSRLPRPDVHDQEPI